MTIGDKMPFRETLTVDRAQFHTSPRVSFTASLTSEATEANPALMCVPTSHSLMAIQISSIHFELESSGDAALYHPQLEDLAVNLCLQLTDDCGRPQGPFVPVAAVSKLLQHQTSYGVGFTTRATIPIPRAKRVTWCLRTNTRVHAPHIITCTIVGVAFVTSIAEATEARLSNSLSKMIKNSGIEARSATSTLVTAAKGSSSSNSDQSAPDASNATGAKRQRDEKRAVESSSAPSKQRSKSEKLAAGRESSHSWEDGTVPSLAYAFVQGGPDES